MKNEKKIIMIVDDSIMVLERMISVLELMNNIQCIVHAGSYTEAMTLLDQLTPDIALLDIHLPDRNGIELLKMIRTRHGEMKVCMVSNEANDFYRSTCKKMGALHFFDKSNDFDLIPEIIGNAAF